jgi:hypothetical protein
MAKRAHLQRDLSLGAALVTLLALMTVRAGVADPSATDPSATDPFATDPFDADLFERPFPSRHFAARPSRHRQRRYGAVRPLLTQVRSGRAWGAEEWIDRRGGVERQLLPQLLPAPSGGRGRSLASVSASVLSCTPTSTSGSTFASWTSSTSSNRSPRNWNLT